MFSVTQTWGDVVIQLVIFFGGSIALFLLKKYAVPWLTEFRARQSISYRRKRIEAFTKALERYEADFADGRLFMARIVLRATYTTLLGVFFVALLLLSWVVAVPDATRCEFRDNCPELYGKIALSFHEWISLPFTTLATMVLGLFFIAWSDLAVQVTPEKYRNRLKERITGLQDRA